MPNSLSWDGQEPITDALMRYGVRNDFQAAVDSGKREAAVSILRDVGADELTAWQMIAILIPVADGPPIA